MTKRKRIILAIVIITILVLTPVGIYFYLESLVVPYSPDYIYVPDISTKVTKTGDNYTINFTKVYIPKTFIPNFIFIFDSSINCRIHPIIAIIKMERVVY